MTGAMLERVLRGLAHAELTRRSDWVDHCDGHCDVVLFQLKEHFPTLAYLWTRRLQEYRGIPFGCNVRWTKIIRASAKTRKVRGDKTRSENEKEAQLVLQVDFPPNFHRSLFISSSQKAVMAQVKYDRNVALS